MIKLFIAHHGVAPQVDDAMAFQSQILKCSAMHIEFNSKVIAI